MLESDEEYCCEEDSDCDIEQDECTFDKSDVRDFAVEDCNNYYNYIVFYIAIHATCMIC